jgi:hypothetical protein
MASKNAKIVSLLVRKQNAGKLDWEETETSGEFQVAFADFAIRIGRDGNDISVRIFDAEGTFLERFTDDDLREEIEDSYTLMTGLYDNARRSALKVDDKLDDIISELESL